MEIKVTSVKEALKAYLDSYATTDKVFAEKYSDTTSGKSIEECEKYIIQEVRKKAGAKNGVMMTDQEVYGLAVHFYDEPDAKVEGPTPRVTVAKIDGPKQEVEPRADKKKAKKSKTTFPKTETKTVPESADPNIPEPFEFPIF